MRSAHSVEQIRAAEAALMATLPQGTLMQRAAAGLAGAIAEFLDGVYGRRIVLLVGSGDNGGDALFAGARLARRGAAVEAWLLSDRAHAGGVTALREAGGLIGAPRNLREQPDLVVDGIVGIGGAPGLRPQAVEALRLLAGVPVVAVDVPSGVGVDTGEIDGPHVVADLTVTFGTHKACHLVDPAAQACGVVELVDIGLGDWFRQAQPANPGVAQPANAEARRGESGPELEALQEKDVAALLPRPAPDSQKYLRGVVGVRAGSSLYPGAASLSVAGANTGLVGMVRYAGDPGVAARIKIEHPEVVGPGRVQAWVVGSGGADQAADALAAALSDEVPLVVDADALAHLDGPLPVPAVLTPHAGELAGILGVERADIEAHGLRHVRRAAAHYDCTVLLKGRHTLVAAPGRPVRVTTTGTPWLATAGAGDVLGGIVGALLAAGLEPFDAASVGSWLHGAAATLASQGGPIVAGDIARAVPSAVRQLMQG